MQNTPKEYWEYLLTVYDLSVWMNDDIWNVKWSKCKIIVMNMEY